MLLLAAVALALQPDPAALRKVYEDHVARCERDFGPRDARTAQAARDLGFYMRESGDKKAATTAFAMALAIDQANLGPDARQTLAGELALASVSPPPEAEALFRKALTSRGMDSTLAAPALSALGDLRFAAKDPVGAAAAWRLALQHSEIVNGKDSDPVAKILYNLSQVVDTKEAVALLERARAIAVGNFGPNHPETATCEVNLANALLHAGRLSDAVEHARTGLAAFEASLGPRHPRVSVALTTLARALGGQKGADRKSIADLYRRAVEIDRLSLGDKDPQTLADIRALNALPK